MEIHHENTSYSCVSYVKNYKAGHTRFHWHDNIEICQVLDDKKCSFLIDGENINAGKGDILLFHEKTVHSFYLEENDTCVRIIQFPIKIILDITSFASPVKTHITAEEIRKIEGLEEKLENLFVIADEEEVSMIGEDNYVLNSVLLTIYFLLARYFPSEDSKKKQKYEQKEFYKVVEYINNNYKDSINILNISSKFHISRGRLSRIFTKYSGMKMNDYINKLRIKCADKLLNDGVRINEAAFESGFQSIRTFNAIYKSYMGITPTEFIQKEKSHD